ncbi:hypothetical protein [Nonomuraea sp. NPDC001831]|uniref:hypothetical protein n=1 Tax=Nonomuraea sp. NPDC001831 TaxID=3364340 RepID=UPI0036B6D049
MRSRVRYLQGAALPATGLLAGAFGHGAADVAPTFAAVPPDVRLTFHTTMTKVDEPVMRSAMGLAILTTLGPALAGRDLLRRPASGAAAPAAFVLVFVAAVAARPSTSSR